MNLPKRIMTLIIHSLQNSLTMWLYSYGIYSYPLPLIVFYTQIYNMLMYCAYLQSN